MIQLMSLVVLLVLLSITSTLGEETANLQYEPPPRKGCNGIEELPVGRTNTTTRLQALRTEMAKEGLAGYVVPSTDAHQSEYVAPEDKRRAWLSGYTGSNGLAVVTM